MSNGYCLKKFIHADLLHIRSNFAACWQKLSKGENGLAMNFRFCLAVFFLFMATSAPRFSSNAAESKPGASPENSPTAQEIINKAVARAESQYQSLSDAEFESNVLSVVQSFDNNKKITRTESTRYRQYPVHGALFEELVEKNGRMLSSSESRNEEKRKEDFIREVQKRRARGDHPQPESEPGIRFNREFVSRYTLSTVGMETVGGNRCWIIAFEPKQGKLPVRNRMDRALNQSNGRFWVSQDDYGLARVEFALRKPFEYWGGFLAVIRNTDGRMDYVRAKPGVWLPSDFELKLDLKIMMVKDIHRLFTKKWSEYKRFDGSDRLKADSAQPSSHPRLELFWLDP
jgi:hypothetical protein